MGNLTGHKIQNTYQRLLQIDRFIVQEGTGSADLTALGISGSLSVTGSQVITGNLEVVGDVTARSIITQLTQSTVLYRSGSTQFGNSLDDTHVFTGSVNISSSFDLIGDSTHTGNASQTGNSTLIGTATVTGSLLNSGSSVTEGTHEVKEGVYGAFFANPQTINKNVTIPASYNSRIFGPITVAAGKTLTVEANAKLEIIDI